MPGGQPQQSCGHPWKHSRRRTTLHLTAALGLLALLCCLSPRSADGRLRAQPKWEFQESVEMTCALESFYVLDGNVLAKRAGVPLCHAEKMFHVSTENGAVYFKDHDLKGKSAPHFFGTYAAPWFLDQVIADGPFETRNIDTAELVYVNVYCYHMWWMAAANSPEASKDDESPGSYLVKLYEEAMKTDRWKTANGRDFVFFMPYGLQQVWHSEHARPDGGMMQPYLNMVCKKLHRSLQIMVESMQMNICKQDREDVMIAPFVPNVVNAMGNALVESLTAMERHLNRFENRTTLVQFKGHCSSTSHNPSRMLRTKVAETMQDQGKDVDISCIDADEEGDSGRLSFEQLLSEMEKSVFCLVLPENGQSTRLLSEIMLAGCIPVFLGPPFGAMPFSKDVDYSSFSVIIHLDDNKDWMEQPSTRRSDKDKLTLGAEMWRDPVVESVTLDEELASVTDVLPFLRNVPKDVQKEGLNAVAAVRRNFMFFPDLDAEKPSAVDLMLLNLCRRMNSIQNTPQEPESDAAEEGESQDAEGVGNSETQAVGNPAQGHSAKKNAAVAEEASKDTPQKRSRKDAGVEDDAQAERKGTGKDPARLGKRGKGTAAAGKTSRRPGSGKAAANTRLAEAARARKAAQEAARLAAEEEEKARLAAAEEEEDLEDYDDNEVPEPQKVKAEQPKAQTLAQSSLSGVKSGVTITKADLDVSANYDYDYDAGQEPQVVSNEDLMEMKQGEQREQDGFVLPQDLLDFRRRF